MVNSSLKIRDHIPYQPAGGQVSKIAYQNHWFILGLVGLWPEGVMKMTGGSESVEWLRLFGTDEGLFDLKWYQRIMSSALV